MTSSTVSQVVYSEVTLITDKTDKSIKVQWIDKRAERCSVPRAISAWIFTVCLCGLPALFSENIRYNLTGKKIVAKSEVLSEDEAVKRWSTNVPIKEKTAFAKEYLVAKLAFNLWNIQKSDDTLDTALSKEKELLRHSPLDPAIQKQTDVLKMTLDEAVLSHQGLFPLESLEQHFIQNTSQEKAKDYLLLMKANKIDSTRIARRVNDLREVVGRGKLFSSVATRNLRTLDTWLTMNKLD